MSQLLTESNIIMLNLDNKLKYNNFWEKSMPFVLVHIDISNLSKSIQLIVEILFQTLNETHYWVFLGSHL